MSPLDAALLIGAFFVTISLAVAVLLGIHDLIAWLNNRRRA